MSLHHATVHDLDHLTARVFDTATRKGGCRMDAHRIDDTLYVDIDLPGVDPAGIDVTADDRVLTVRAERRPLGRDDPSTGPAEPTSAPVTRHVSVSDALDPDRLDARYDHGVLTVRIPVSAPAVTRTVEVDSGDHALAA